MQIEIFPSELCFGVKLFYVRWKLGEQARECVTKFVVVTLRGQRMRARCIDIKVYKF